MQQTHAPARPATQHLKPFTGWCLLALAFCLLLSGCAGTARGNKTSVYKERSAQAPAFSELPRSEALVVIRYPAIIHADAELPFYHAFASNAIGGTVPIEVKIRNDTTRVAQAVIAKTNYFAMTLYRELQKSLPADSVLLSPHIIVYDKEKRLHSRPMLASEQIPSAITIDFSVYSYPDVSKIMDSPPLTFGDIVTPLFVVHGNRWLRPSTHGLMLASEPFLQTSWELSKENSQHQFAQMLDYPAPLWQRPLDFISYINPRDATAYNVPTKAIGDSGQPVLAVESYPLEKIQMNPERVAQLSANEGVDPFAEVFVKGAADRVLKLLANIDRNRASFFARQRALQRFDPELATVFFTRSEDESVRARLQLAEALIEAEKKFLSRQSQSVFEGTYQGDYGQKMRQMIEAEYNMLEERRRLARIQNVTTAVAAVMLAGSVYGTAVSGSVVASALQNISGVLVIGSIWAARSSFKTRAKSGAISEKFLALMAPALDRQVDVQMEWMESKEQITARGFAEFRDKTMALYQSRIRSLTGAMDDSCRFSHPQVAAEGRWYGGCKNGQAEGGGYGLVRDGRGNAVEYLGEAHQGLASGTGGMIVYRPDTEGALYFEGKFRHGLPDGIVQVAEPGRKARVRTYRAGDDTGKATESQWSGLAF